MTKYFPLCLILVAGCVIHTEPEGYNESVVEDELGSGWDGPNTDAPGDLGCSGEVVEMPDGSYIMLPGLCAPFYIYMGYPDPTENSYPYEDPTNPHEEIFETKQYKE